MGPAGQSTSLLLVPWLGRVSVADHNQTDLEAHYAHFRSSESRKFEIATFAR